MTQKSAANEIAELIIDADKNGIDAFKGKKYNAAVEQTITGLEAAKEINFAPITNPDVSSPEKFAQGLESVYQKLDQPSEVPSVYSVVKAGIESTGLSLDDPLSKSALMVAVLAQGDTSNPYHNSDHTFNVVGNTIGLINGNDKIAGKSVAPLSPQEKVKMILASTMHDLGHPGGNNKVDNVAVPFRLEDQSFKIAEPIMQANGVKPQDISDIHVMVRTTDVGGPAQLADKVLKNEAVEENDANRGYYSAIVEPLKYNPRLGELSATLRAADIMSTTVMSPESLIERGDKVAQELSKNSAAKETVGSYTYFAERIVGESLPGNIAKDLGLNENWRANRKAVMSKLVAAAEQPARLPQVTAKRM